MLVGALCYGPILWRYQMFLGGPLWFNMWQGIVRRWQGMVIWSMLAKISNLPGGPSALTCGKGLQARVWQIMVCFGRFALLSCGVFCSWVVPALTRGKECSW